MLEKNHFFAASMLLAYTASYLSAIEPNNQGDIMISLERTPNIQTHSPTSSLIDVIANRVRETINKASEIPGLQANEFLSLKPGILERWETLLQKGALEVNATDKEVRPYFVSLQGILEHVLAFELKKSICSLSGVICTPLPPTPLCTKGEISKGLVSPSIEEDQNRLFTVKARPTIVRDFLYQGGDLYAAYPKGGLGKRTEEQQKIYLQELKNYPAHLFDRELECESVETDLIGAVYTFKDQRGDSYAFAIKMTQATNPSDQGHFGLWFGSINNPVIRKRVDDVLNFASKNSSKPINL